MRQKAELTLLVVT